jgi:hypothetical protein
MVRKVQSILAAVLVLALVSCKNDSAVSKIDNNTTAIPPASPEAVVLAEPNNLPAEQESPQAAATPPADGKYAVMSFSKNEHDFGIINDTDAVTYSFKFTNTGEGDLIITSAKGSCGCTVPDYPKDPIKPGASGKIKVSFNPTGKKGQQHKTVTINTNTARGQETLSVKATIKEKQ